MTLKLALGWREEVQQVVEEWDVEEGSLDRVMTQKHWNLQDYAVYQKVQVHS